MPAVAGGAGGRGRWSPPLGVRGWVVVAASLRVDGVTEVVNGTVDGVLAGVTMVRAATDLPELNQRQESLCLGFMIWEKDERLEFAKLPPDWQKEWEE